MDSQMRVLAQYEKIVRTAEGLEKNKEICQEALMRIIQAIKEAKEILKLDLEDEIIALSTQALREAKNRDYILQAIKESTQISFRVISEKEESFITSLAPKIEVKRISQSVFKYCQDCFLLIDMGGGSSEFVFCQDQRIFAKSFKIGIVRSKDKYGNIVNLWKHKKEIIAPILEFILESFKKGIDGKFLVANSGTPTSVCVMKFGLEFYEHQKYHGIELKRSDFQEQLERFLHLPYEEKISLFGIFQIDVIPFGISLFLMFMEALKFEEVLVIDKGLREGAVIGRIEGIF
ncbi:MAG: phosphatase [Helicobacter sp.]|nr:phosphatase [Helicobacter sp.]